MILGTTLYVNNSIEAVELYCKAFNMTVGYNAKNNDGSYLHVELEKNGKSIFALSESNDDFIRKAMIQTKQPTISLGISIENNTELEHAFTILSEQGHVIRPLGELPWSPYSADLVDRFGVCWYIYVSQYKPEEKET